MEARVAIAAFATALFKSTFTRRNLRIALFSLVACTWASHYALAQAADSAAGVAAGSGVSGVIKALFTSLPSWVGIAAFLASEVIGALPTKSNGVFAFAINFFKTILNGFKTKL